MNKTHNSIEAFNEALLAELKGSSLAKKLSPALFTIWFGKLLIFMEFLKKIDEPTIKENITRYAKLRSRKSPGFLCNQAFGALVKQAKRDKNFHSPSRNFKYNLVAFNKAFWKGSHFLKNIYLMTKLHVLMRIPNTSLLVFCDRRIEPKAAKEFFDDQHSAASYHPIPFKTASNWVNLPTCKKEALDDIQKAELKRLLKSAVARSIAKRPKSEFDTLVTSDLLMASINEWEAYFPDALINSISERTSMLSCKRNVNKSLIIIDDSGEILRNHFLTRICQKYDTNLYCYQHGGQYGEIRSILSSVEITNAAYDLGFLGWGFGLNKANFRKSTNRYRNNKIGLANTKAVLYPQSNHAKELAHTPADEEIVDKIEATKTVIVRCLPRIATNYWIKRHPKSHFPEKNICNFDTNQILKTRTKPTLDSKSIQLVIFDSPGQSLMYSCLDERIKYLFCFNFSCYDLTDQAKKYFRRLEEVGFFVDADKPEIETRLKFAVEQALQSPFSNELAP